MKKILLIIAPTAILFFVLGAGFAEKGIFKMTINKAFQLEEPLLIEGQRQNSYSLLPAGTVLYYDKSWDEGHSTYHVYFNFKGDFKSSEVSAEGIDPIWLRNIPKDELPKFLAEYPLSSQDLQIILKSSRVTKQDLVQILRDWDEK